MWRRLLIALCAERRRQEMVNEKAAPGVLHSLSRQQGLLAQSWPGLLQVWARPINDRRFIWGMEDETFLLEQARVMVDQFPNNY